MADFNDGDILTFKFGGEIKITPEGGSEATVANVIGGTLRYKPSMRATLPPDVDRGLLLDDVRKGDYEPGELDFDIKFTGDTGATEMHELLTAEGTGQAKPKFDIDIEWYSDEAKTTGKRLPLTNCVVREAPNTNTGDSYDMINCRFLTPDTAAPAAITP